MKYWVILLCKNNIFIQTEKEQVVIFCILLHMIIWINYFLVLPETSSFRCTLWRMDLHRQIFVVRIKNQQIGVHVWSAYLKCDLSMFSFRYVPPEQVKTVASVHASISGSSASSTSSTPEVRPLKTLLGESVPSLHLNKNTPSQVTTAIHVIIQLKIKCVS